MTAEKSIKLDLQRPGPAQIIHAKQGEKLTRSVKIDLYNDGVAWIVPSGAQFWVNYRKSDGKGGKYSDIDGLLAVSANGYTLTVSLAPQVLTCAGLVCCEVHMASSQYTTDDLSTFSFYVDVQASAESGITSEDYWNMARDEKVVLLNARIGETANTVQTFDSALFIPTPNLDDRVLGTNGYVGTVTAANSSTVTVRATGEQWGIGAANVSAEDVSYTPTGANPYYDGKNTVKAVLDALTERDVKLYFTEADISAVAGDVTDLDGFVTHPSQPRDGEYVVGKNGNLAYADTSIASGEVAVVSIGQKLFNLGGYEDKTADYIWQSTYDSSEDFLLSLGDGRYEVNEGTLIRRIDTVTIDGLAHHLVTSFLDDSMRFSVYDGSTEVLCYDSLFGVTTPLKVITPTDEDDEEQVANRKYVDNLVKMGYIDKSNEFHEQDTYDDEGEFLRSLGFGRFYVNENGGEMYAIETYDLGGTKHSTLRSYVYDGSETCEVYENDKLRLAWKRESGQYTVTSGNITIGNNAALEVPTAYDDRYGYSSSNAASKGYVDNMARVGYINMTTAYMYQDDYDDVAEYLMSLGEGHWMFDSERDQRAEDLAKLVLVECVSYVGCKFWTVRAFCDDGSLDINMYGQYSDDPDERWHFLNIFADAACRFGVNELSSLTAGSVYLNDEPTVPRAATTKKYVDDAIAALLPAYTADDAGKVLKVASDGTLYWGTDNAGITVDSGRITLGGGLTT